MPSHVQVQLNWSDEDVDVEHAAGKELQLLQTKPLEALRKY
jgi:hypothetical protein